MVEQSNPGGRPWMLIIFCFCCAWAELAVIAENVPRPASARKTPARTVHTPIRTRRLKKAWQAFFYFFCGLGRRTRNFRWANEFSPAQTGRDATLRKRRFSFLLTT